MGDRKTLRISLADLAVDFANSLVHTLLSGSADELREVLATSLANSSSAPTPSEPSAAPARAPSSRRRRARVLQGGSSRLVQASAPEIPESEPVEDVVIIDPETMLRTLSEQRDALPSPSPSPSRTRVGTPPAVLKDVEPHTAPPSSPTREPAAREGKQVLWSAGGGFVLRRARPAADLASLPEIATEVSPSEPQS